MSKTTESAVVRPRRPGDDPFIHALAERAFRSWSARPGSTVAAMLDGPGAHAIVAEAGRAQLGFAIVSLSRHPRDFGPWVRPVLASLDAIAVRPEAQNRKLGKLLLAHAEELSRAEGAVSMSLDTARTNVRARKLFDGAGYLTFAVLRSYYASGQTALHMLKLL